MVDRLSFKKSFLNADIVPSTLETYIDDCLKPDSISMCESCLAASN